MRIGLEKAMAQIALNQDTQEAKIKQIESFTDRYIPVRIMHQVKESLNVVMTRHQMRKYEQYERERYKNLN